MYIPIEVKRFSEGAEDQGGSFDMLKPIEHIIKRWRKRVMFVVFDLQSSWLDDCPFEPTGQS